MAGKIFEKYAQKEIAPKLGVAFLGSSLVATITGYFSFKKVDAGYIGFKNLFGRVSEQQYESGFHFLNPFSKIVRMNLRNRVLQNDSEIASQEGLPINVVVDAVFRLDKSKARDVYINIGPNYPDVILRPQLKSIIRDTIAAHEAKALYSEDSRGQIRNKILEELRKKTEEKGVYIEDILINKITLPRQLTRAIETKLEAEQEMQRMSFVVERERKEAERKAVEADGIKQFQDIVSMGISDKLLQWKGIKATEELAKSNNTKIVVVGGKDGLPLIFNAEH